MGKKLTTSNEKSKRLATLFPATVLVCRMPEMAINVSAAVTLARFTVNVQLLGDFTSKIACKLH